MVVATWMTTCNKKPSVIWLFCLEYRNSTTYEWLDCERLFASSKAKQPVAVSPLVVGSISAFSLDFYLDVMHVGSSLGEEHVIRGNSPKRLPAALVSADETSVNTTPYPNHCYQHLPCQSRCHISCPHHRPPYTPNSCFSLLAEQNSPLVLTRHFILSNMQNLLLGAQPKPPGREAGNYRVLDHSLHSCLDNWFRGLRPPEWLNHFSLESNSNRETAIYRAQ